MDKKTFLHNSASSYNNTIIHGWEKLYSRKWKYLYTTLKKHFVSGHVLELGCADGIITKQLCKDFKKVTVVDGSKLFIDQVRNKIRSKKLTFVHSLFENYNPSEKYDTIFMTHILEHLTNPVQVLKRSKKWLKPNGSILIDVPNANSIHRHIGVKLGLLSKKNSLNKQDKLLGHKRIYTPQLLTQHINKAGLRVAHFGGIMIKPLSNRQIEQQWSDKLIDAFFKLGNDFPEICSEIYMVVKKK